MPGWSLGHLSYGTEWARDRGQSRQLSLEEEEADGVMESGNGRQLWVQRDGSEYRRVSVEMTVEGCRPVSGLLPV